MTDIGFLFSINKHLVLVKATDLSRDKQRNRREIIDITRFVFPNECTSVISIDRSCFVEHEKWKLHFINNMF